MKGQSVGVITAADLVRLFSAELEIRKSGREGAKYPLYLSTNIGPLHLNTRAAQDFLLEHGKFKGADPDIEKEPAAEVSKVREGVPAVDHPKPEPEPEAEQKKRGFLDTFFNGDDVLI